MLWSLCFQMLANYSEYSIATITADLEDSRLVDSDTAVCFIAKQVVDKPDPQAGPKLCNHLHCCCSMVADKLPVNFSDYCFHRLVNLQQVFPQLPSLYSRLLHKVKLVHQCQSYRIGSLWTLCKRRSRQSEQQSRRGTKSCTWSLSNHCLSCIGL